MKIPNWYVSALADQWRANYREAFETKNHLKDKDLDGKKDARKNKKSI